MNRRNNINFGRKKYFFYEKIRWFALFWGVLTFNEHFSQGICILICSIFERRSTIKIARSAKLSAHFSVDERLFLQASTKKILQALKRAKKIFIAHLSFAHFLKVSVERRSLPDERTITLMVRKLREISSPHLKFVTEFKLKRFFWSCLKTKSLWMTRKTWFCVPKSYANSSFA